MQQLIGAGSIVTLRQLLEDREGMFFFFFFFKCKSSPG